MADRAGWLGVTRGSWPGDSGGRAALSFRAERERSEESRVSPRSMVLTRGGRHAAAAHGSAPGAARRVPCDARRRGPRRNSLRAVPALRSDMRRELDERGAAAPRARAPRQRRGCSPDTNSPQGLFVSGLTFSALHKSPQPHAAHRVAAASTSMVIPSGARNLRFHHGAWPCPAAGGTRLRLMSSAPGAVRRVPCELAGKQRGPVRFSPDRAPAPPAPRRPTRRIAPVRSPHAPRA